MMQFILPDGAFPLYAFEFFKLFLNYSNKYEKCCHLYNNNMLSCNILHSSHVLSRFLFQQALVFCQSHFYLFFLVWENISNVMCANGK